MTEFIKKHEKEFREDYADVNPKQIVTAINYLLENSIPKQKVKEALEDIEDYFERLNGPDEDIEYIRQVKQELLEGEK